MSSPPQHSIVANVQLTVHGRRLDLSMRVPTGPSRSGDLLPLFQAIADTMVNVAVAEATEAGRTISCRKGCGACCRQYVPLTPTEAHAIARLVEQLPEPRRTQVRHRFDDARARLQSAGMLERLRDEHLRGLSGDAIRRLGLDYFALGIACPFLEDESCSIHAQRPIACRDYLVTSPAENCANPTPQTVRMVGGPIGKAWRALAELDAASTGRPAARLPLVLALEFASAHPEAPPSSSGAALLRDFFAAMTGAPQDIPPAPGLGQL